jgi:hypothetical protein
MKIKFTVKESKQLEELELKAVIMRKVFRF